VRSILEMGAQIHIARNALICRARVNCLDHRDGVLGTVCNHCFAFDRARIASQTALIHVYPGIVYPGIVYPGVSFWPR